MALLRSLSKAILPNLERDLGKSISTEMDTVSHMVDNLLAPSVFGYAPSSGRGGGIGGRTATRQSPHRPLLVKTVYPTQPQGLMQDPQESWHHVVTATRK